VLGLVGLLAEELSAAAVDGKITVNEALRIVKRICDSLGIEFVAELDE
jgi:transcription termination factor NusB